MLRFLLLSLPAALLVTAGTAWAAPAGSCPRMGEPKVVIDSTLAPLEHDYTQPIAALATISRSGGAVTGKAGGRPSKILGLAWVRYGNAEEATLSLAQQPDGSLCAAPSEVRLHLRLEERRVYVARELPEGTCIHDEVLAHEMRHVRTDEQLVSEFLPRAEARVRAELLRLGTFRIAGQDDARNRLNGVMNSLMQSLLRDFGAERTVRQARIDTLLEYRRVSVSCNGELAKYLHPGEGTL